MTTKIQWLGAPVTPNQKQIIAFAVARELLRVAGPATLNNPALYDKAVADGQAFADAFTKCTDVTPGSFSFNGTDDDFVRTVAWKWGWWLATKALSIQAVIGQLDSSPCVTKAAQQMLSDIAALPPGPVDKAYDAAKNDPAYADAKTLLSQDNLAPFDCQLDQIWDAQKRTCITPTPWPATQKTIMRTAVAREYLRKAGANNATAQLQVALVEGQAFADAVVQCVADQPWATDLAAAQEMSCIANKWLDLLPSLRHSLLAGASQVPCSTLLGIRTATGSCVPSTDPIYQDVTALIAVAANPNPYLCAAGALWDDVAGRCVSCPKGQTWNSATQACMPIPECPSGSVWDYNTHSCEKAQCDSGAMWNDVLKKCVPSSEPGPGQKPTSSGSDNTGLLIVGGLLALVAGVAILGSGDKTAKTVPERPLNQGPLSRNPARGRGARTFYAGERVVSTQGASRGQRGVIVPLSSVPTDGRGIPTLNKGHYHPINYREDIAVRLDDGTMDVWNMATVAIERESPHSNPAAIAHPRIVIAPIEPNLLNSFYTIEVTKETGNAWTGYLVEGGRRQPRKWQFRKSEWKTTGRGYPSES